jgi:hypothetical protein
MKVSEFASLLFEIEVVTHIAHLQTTSFAQHMALNDIYQGIVDHRDSFIESYQGKYGIITGYTTTSPKEGIDPVTYLEASGKQIEDFRLTLTCGYLQQICDDILELINSTLYKLKFLS